jgi:haloalkane dehalogenase
MKNSLLSFIFTFIFLTSVKAQFSTFSYQEFSLQQKQFKTSAGLNIAYTDVGNSQEVVLLMHGVPTNSWLFRKTIDSLVLLNKRVIAPDFIGFGNSDKPKDTDNYLFDKQAKTIFELMNALRIPSWTQVCHDMGSLVTWQMLDQDKKQQIKKLVVLNAIISKEGFNPPMKMKKGFFGKTYASIYCSWLGKAMVKATLNNGIYCQKVDTEGLNGYVKPLKKQGNRALYHFFTSIPDFTETLSENILRLSTYKGELLFVWGVHDKILTLTQLEALTLSNLHVIKLEQSGHFVPEQELKANIRQVF